MSDGKRPVLFVDTSSLRGAGFNHPDLQKLLLRSKEGTVRTVVSAIAWEEWRTQMLAQECDAVREIRSRFDKLHGRLSSSHIFRRLTPPALVLWAEAEIEAASKEALDAYASENKIEVVGIGSDHGDRAWKRYFAINPEPPFNPATDRETRRKDIPDSWILEAAIDLVAAGNEVLALCHDDKLRAALVANGAKGFKQPADVLNELEKSPSAEVATERRQGETQPTDLVSAALSQAHERFRDLDRTVLGFVAALDAPTKQELFTMLQRVGVAVESARNVAERLVLAGVLKDTGNHYILADLSLAASAASRVEADVIALLKGS